MLLRRRIDVHLALVRPSLKQPNRCSDDVQRMSNANFFMTEAAMIGSLLELDVTKSMLPPHCRSLRPPRPLAAASTTTRSSSPVPAAAPARRTRRRAAAARTPRPLPGEPAAARCGSPRITAPARRARRRAPRPLPGESAAARCGRPRARRRVVRPPARHRPCPTSPPSRGSRCAMEEVLLDLDLAAPESMHHGGREP